MLPRRRSAASLRGDVDLTDVAGHLARQPGRPARDGRPVLAALDPNRLAGVDTHDDVLAAHRANKRDLERPGVDYSDVPRYRGTERLP